MKKLFIAIAMVSICGILFSQTFEKPKEIANSVLTLMVKKDFSKVIPFFDETMTKALTAEKLGDAWATVNQQCGVYEKSGDITTATIQGYRVVYILCVFKSAKLKFKTVYDKNDKIAGLFFVPENQQ